MSRGERRFRTHQIARYRLRWSERWDEKFYARASPRLVGTRKAEFAELHFWSKTTPGNCGCRHRRHGKPKLSWGLCHETTPPPVTARRAWRQALHRWFARAEEP